MAIDPIPRGRIIGDSWSCKGPVPFGLIRGSRPKFRCVRWSQLYCSPYRSCSPPIPSPATLRPRSRDRSRLTTSSSGLLRKIKISKYQNQVYGLFGNNCELQTAVCGVSDSLKTEETRGGALGRVQNLRRQYCWVTQVNLISYSLNMMVTVLTEL